MAVLAPPETVQALERLRDIARDGSAADVAEAAYALLIEVYGPDWEEHDG
jgi:hypothetical protein